MFDIGSVLWHSDNNSDGFSALGGKGDVSLENDKRSGLHASGISFIHDELLREVGHLAVV